MPENSTKIKDNVSTSTGDSFAVRRQEIYNRLQQSVEQCVLHYDGRTELANKLDDLVMELIEALEDAFNYGLRQQNSSVKVTAASLLQNVQEIVSGNVGIATSNEITFFWDFCQLHLTIHERERFESLKRVWTKCGFGRSFIRTALNENSLQRYILIWLNEPEQLEKYYTNWSLFLNSDTSKNLPQLIGKLNSVVFALDADTIELNVNAKNPSTSQKSKLEPRIFAPTPVPVEVSTQKRKMNPIERPIVTSTSFESRRLNLKETEPLNDVPISKPQQITKATVQLAVEALRNSGTPPDDIGPELEFLKTPLLDLRSSYSPTEMGNGSLSSSVNANESDSEDRSETSSQYSKSSSANCSANHSALEHKLQQMSERCALLETRVAKLSLENNQLTRRLTQFFKESGIDPSSSLSNNFLITLPQAQLRKSKHGRSSYYSYEIHITMRQHLEHWTIWRRYQEFYKLHKSLLRTHPSISSVEFPPKKHFGNMNEIFVDERRQQLQIYLINLVESLPQVEMCKTKSELQRVFPFLRER